MGAFSVAVIATMFSLLRRDPLAIFAGGSGLPIPTLVRRDLPKVYEAALPEINMIEEHRRQLSKRQATIPSLSGELPGAGVGGIPGSGLAGTSKT